MSGKLKKLSIVLMSILFITAVLPTKARAQGKIDLTRRAELTISYMDGEKAIPEARFNAYKLADIDEYGEVKLSSAMDKYKTTISGLSELDKLTQEDWIKLASTLKGYVQADGLTTAASDMTNKEGKLVFTLEPGIYLVFGYRATTDDYYTYTSDPFTVLLPGRDSAKNDWSYAVTATPKFEKEFYPPDDNQDRIITRKVLKQWDDEGYESIRPEEVTVKLLMDGKVHDTQTLNKDNNWRYAWDNLDSAHEWDIVENPVEGYAVSITRTGITFTVSNKYIASITNTDPPVQKRITGDKPDKASAFTFVLTAKDVSCPMPEGSSGTVKEMTITGAGSKEFGEIIFTKAGTYVYTISEKNTAAEGYTYDTEVYTLSYEVTEKDGELSIDLKVTDHEGKDASAIEFTNKYTTPGNKLPQTGMLWWPVPVLLCAGLLCLMIGILRRRRCDG